jgi:hypothetical protein
MSSKFNSALLIFKLLMSLVYIAIGLSFIFSPRDFGTLIPAQYLPILGGLLVAYGIYRGYRAYFVERKG